MAGEVIYAARYAKYPTDPIAGITHAALPGSAESIINPGAAGATGLLDKLVHYRGLDVVLFGIDNVYPLRAKVTVGTVTLDRIVHARLTPATGFGIDRGETASPGVAGALVTYYGLAVELFGDGFAELLALIGAVKATVTLPIHGLAGAEHEISITNVYFDEVLGEIGIPANDAGGRIASMGIRGHVLFGAGETFADVITADPTNFTAALALIGADAANLVLGIEGAAGVNEKLTVKNVYFCKIGGALEIPAFDAGGKLAPFGIGGVALWGAADTFALMVLAAADA